jgi:RNA-directed DNA polymerase
MGKLFMNFSPAISSKAAKSIRDEIRKWKIHLRSDKQIDDLARMFNAQVQGWINYYGAYYRSALRPILSQFERELVRWAKRKYKKMRGHHMRAVFWLGRVSRREPKLFAHWRFGVNSSVGKMGAV